MQVELFIVSHRKAREVGFVIGVARNACLQKAVADWEAELEQILPKPAVNSA